MGKKNINLLPGKRYQGRHEKRGNAEKREEEIESYASSENRSIPSGFESGIVSKFLKSGKSGFIYDGLGTYYYFTLRDLMFHPKELKKHDIVTFISTTRYDAKKKRYSPCAVCIDKTIK